MTRLLVRDLEPEIVQALKRRAAKHGHSAEAEHREILRQALLGSVDVSHASLLGRIFRSTVLSFRLWSSATLRS